MATRKEVKNRISSVKNVQKITRAMEMVAAARLRRAEQRIDALRPYARELRKMTRQVAEAAGGEARNLPVLQEHEEQKTVGILLVTGDRGLAGSFNSQIIRAGVQLQRQLRGEGKDVRFSVVGRRGVSTMRFRGEDLHGDYVGFTDRPAFANAREIADDLIASYVDKDLNRVDLIYNRYVSPLTQYVRRQTLLPVQQAEVFGEGVVELTPDEESDCGTFDVIVELVGGANCLQRVSQLRTGGKFLIVGVQAGMEASLSMFALMLARATVIGTTIRGRSHAEKSC